MTKARMHPLFRMLLNDPKARLRMAVSRYELRRPKTAAWWRGYLGMQMRMNMRAAIAKASLTTPSSPPA